MAMLASDIMITVEREKEKLARGDIHVSANGQRSTLSHPPRSPNQMPVQQDKTVLDIYGETG